MRGQFSPKQRSTGNGSRAPSEQIKAASWSRRQPATGAFVLARNALKRRPEEEPCRSFTKDPARGVVSVIEHIRVRPAINPGARPGNRRCRGSGEPLQCGLVLEVIVVPIYREPARPYGSPGGS